MIDPTASFLALLSALSGGLALGAAFYGSLWLTVRRCVSSDRPVRWFFGGLVVRTGAAMVGIWLIGDGDWQRLTACLLGFMTARLLAIRVCRLTGMRFDGRET